MTERICPYCERPNPVSALSYAENPFCQACLRERVDEAAKVVGPVTWRRVGKMLVPVPLSSISKSE